MDATNPFHVFSSDEQQARLVLERQRRMAARDNAVTAAALDAARISHVPLQGMPAGALFVDGQALAASLTAPPEGAGVPLLTKLSSDRVSRIDIARPDTVTVLAIDGEAPVCAPPVQAIKAHFTAQLRKAEVLAHTTRAEPGLFSDVPILAIFSDTAAQPPATYRKVASTKAIRVSIQADAFVRDATAVIETLSAGVSVVYAREPAVLSKESFLAQWTTQHAPVTRDQFLRAAKTASPTYKAQYARVEQADRRLMTTKAALRGVELDREHYRGRHRVRSALHDRDVLPAPVLLAAEAKRVELQGNHSEYLIALANEYALLRAISDRLALSFDALHGPEGILAQTRRNILDARSTLGAGVGPLAVDEQLLSVAHKIT